VASKLKIIEASVIERSVSVFLARLIAPSGSNVVKSDLSSVVVDIYDTTNLPSIKTYSSSLNISEIIYDTLQLDGRWTVDKKGYNFAHQMPSSVFSSTSKKYQVQYRFTLVNGNLFTSLYRITVENIHS
jgi:hypothetical protein